MDGKCLRGSIDKATNKSAIYMVSAWSDQNPLVLGQQKVDDKSNEITAIPKLLEWLDITGAVITMDVMGCQTAIAEQIIEKKFESKNTCPEVGYESYNGKHGRHEKRAVRATPSLDKLKKHCSTHG